MFIIKGACHLPFKEVSRLFKPVARLPYSIVTTKQQATNGLRRESLL